MHVGRQRGRSFTQIFIAAAIAILLFQSTSFADPLDNVLENIAGQFAPQTRIANREIDLHPVITLSNGQRMQVNLRIHAGQAITFQQDGSTYRFSVVSPTSDNRTGDINLSSAQISQWFGGRVNGVTTQNPENGLVIAPDLVPSRGGGQANPCLDTMLRMESSPYSLAGQPRGTQYPQVPSPQCSGDPRMVRITQLKDTRIIDLGLGREPRWTTVQQICFRINTENSTGQERCGWVRGSALASYGNAPISDSAMPTAAPRPPQSSPPAPRPANTRPPQNSQPATRPANRPTAPAGSQGQRPCPNNQSNTSRNTRDLRQVADAAATPGFTGRLGVCAPFSAQAYSNQSLTTYDSTVLPYANAAFRRPPPPNMAQSDFIAIDVLARTIYGEMRNASCGINYMRAVAKTIINRAESAQRDVANNDNPYFANPSMQSASRRDYISRVCLADNQYSLWNHSQEGGAQDERNFRSVICPDRDSAGWTNAVRVATEAILNRPAFDRMTASMPRNTYHYRSNRPALGSNYRALTAQEAVVNGERLTNGVCIQLYTPGAGRSH